MEKYIKNWLKNAKFNEPTISTILGFLVVVIVGVLILNYWKSGSVNQPNQPEISVNETENENLLTTHLVEPAEDLWKISEKYYQDGYKWVKIAKENNLSNPDFLEVGQELRIPKLIANIQESGSVEQLNQELPIDTITDQSNSITGNTYKVLQGDYLWSIALRAYGDGYKWSEIAKANNLTYPDLLEVGQELSLPR